MCVKLGAPSSLARSLVTRWQPARERSSSSIIRPTTCPTARMSGISMSRGHCLNRRHFDIQRWKTSMTNVGRSSSWDLFWHRFRHWKRYRFDDEISHNCLTPCSGIQWSVDPHSICAKRRSLNQTASVSINRKIDLNKPINQVRIPVDSSKLCGLISRRVCLV